MDSGAGHAGHIFTQASMPAPFGVRVPQVIPMVPATAVAMSTHWVAAIADPVGPRAYADARVDERVRQNSEEIAPPIKKKRKVNRDVLHAASAPSALHPLSGSLSLPLSLSLSLSLFDYLSLSHFGTRFSSEFDCPQNVVTSTYNSLSDLLEDRLLALSSTCFCPVDAFLNTPPGLHAQCRSRSNQSPPLGRPQQACQGCCC